MSLGFTKLDLMLLHSILLDRMNSAPLELTPLHFVFEPSEPYDMISICLMAPNSTHGGILLNDLRCKRTGYSPNGSGVRGAENPFVRAFRCF